MASQSYTGPVDTNGEFESVEEITGITFTVGENYSIQMQNTAYLKIADAVFTIYTDDPFNFVAGSDTPYIKTNYGKCILTVYGAS